MFFLLYIQLRICIVIIGNEPIKNEKKIKLRSLLVCVTFQDGTNFHSEKYIARVIVA